jgi:gamma-glutamyl hydrolase
MRIIKTLIILIILEQQTKSFYQPVIGILSHPEPENAVDIQESYIQSNYVRWLEAAGARTVPIQPWISPQDLDLLLNKLNGVFLTGGGRDLDLTGQYEKITIQIIKKTIELKDKYNIIFPIWGTCQGFELLHIIVIGKYEIEKFNSYNVRGKLVVDQNVNSKLFGLLSKEEIQLLNQVDSIAKFHNLGFSPEFYKRFPVLKGFFLVSSYSYDKNGNIYVATVEGIKYPIYGVQFHPEKIIYDRHAENDIPQNWVSTKLSQTFGVFFVNEARLNNNTMTDEELQKYGYIDTYKTLPIKVNQGKYEYKYKK